MPVEGFLGKRPFTSPGLQNIIYIYLCTCICTSRRFFQGVCPVCLRVRIRTCRSCEKSAFTAEQVSNHLKLIKLANILNEPTLARGPICSYIDPCREMYIKYFWTRRTLAISKSDWVRLTGLTDDIGWVYHACQLYVLTRKCSWSQNVSALDNLAYMYLWEVY